MTDVTRREALGMGALGALGVGAALGTPAEGSPAPRKPRALWVLPHAGTPPADLMLAQTLQGLTCEGAERIWLRAGSAYAVVEEELRREGVRMEQAGDAWRLLERFRGAARGAVLYRLGTPSVNVATSLCGVLRAVAIDEGQEARARAAGLTVLADARGMTEEDALRQYGPRFARGFIVEQDTAAPGHLRDLAVARRAFTYYTTDAAFRTRVAREFGPAALVYGWGNDEYQWVSDLSRGNATGVAANWAVNLSVMQGLPAGRLRRPRRPTPRPQPGKRYVAFVMSDGDNVQWMCGGFVGNPRYWSSPLRGRFPFTWEVSPMLVDVAPRVLRHLYVTAQPEEGFVWGPGAPGYTFPHLQTERAAIARGARRYARDADLPVVSVLNANAGSLSDTNAILDLPEVEGVIYKDYAPYHRSGGRIHWRRGKPCISYRFMLWDGLMSPEQLAQGVAAMPASPLDDEMSYALVNVHAWSFPGDEGPLAGVQRAIGLLPPNVEVVTADQVVAMLRGTFGARRR